MVQEFIRTCRTLTRLEEVHLGGPWEQNGVATEHSFARLGDFFADRSTTVTSVSLVGLPGRESCIDLGSFVDGLVLGETVKKVSVLNSKFAPTLPDHLQRLLMLRPELHINISGLSGGICMLQLNPLGPYDETDFSILLLQCCSSGLKEVAVRSFFHKCSKYSIGCK